MSQHSLNDFFGKQFPVVMERDESGAYVAECPLLEGCYSQGKTVEEALGNIREAIALVLEEEDAPIKNIQIKEVSLHSVTL